MERGTLSLREPGGPHRPAPGANGVVAALVTAPVLAALYLVFAGQFSRTEAIACAPATVIATHYVFRLRRHAPILFDLRGPWRRVLAATAKALLVDTLQVWWALLRGRGGRRMRQVFRAGAATPHDAGRRALVTLALSLAPNGYVTALAPDSIELHRLAPLAGATDPEWPL